MKQSHKPTLQQRVGDFVRATRRRWHKRSGSVRVKSPKPVVKPAASKVKQLGAPNSNRFINFIRQLPGKTKLIIAFGIMAVFVGLNLYKYFSFPLERIYLDNPQLESKLVLGTQLNVMLFLYEQEGEFSYIDALMLLSFDPVEGRAEVFFLNPEFGTRALGNSYVKIRNLLSNAEITQKQPMKVLASLVEGTLGLPVDRYIGIKSTDLPELLSWLGINSISTVDVVNDPEAGEFKLNERIEGTDIVNYLAADADGNNRKLSRAGKVLEKLLVDETNYFTAISAYLHFDKLTAYMKTDMERGEIVNLANAVWNLRTVHAQYISVNDTFLIENRGNNYLVPNLALTDQKVRAIFARQKVVREQARIEIYNATKTNGLANSFRRQLYNQGGNVIRAGTSPEPEDETLLYVPNLANYPNTVGLIKEITRGKVKLIEEEYPYNHTAELVLVLGSDIVPN